MRETEKVGLVKGFGNSVSSGNNSAFVISVNAKESERVGEMRCREAFGFGVFVNLLA